MPANPPPQIVTGGGGGGAADESSDDHFSSASEGAASSSVSPIPITRVERVDDQASYGEVPGTEAYNKRTRDAVPDEIEVVPDGQRSRSGTRSRALSGVGAFSSEGGADDTGRPSTPGGTPIPKTVVEKVDDKPSHGEVEGTPAKEMRMADAMPDEIRSAPEVARTDLEGSIEDGEVDEEGRQRWFRSMWEEKQEAQEAENLPEDVEDDDDDGDDDEERGDDFDDFAEGGGNDDDDDFGDFDEAESAADEPVAPPTPAAVHAPAPDMLAGLPPLDLSSCSSPDEIQEAITPYINAILPNSEPVLSKSQIPPLDPSNTSPFLSDRSLSLWQQLVSPPPMQPPDWTRSRIRRLFLVSLGVPVDLDEILPPSKQKRLILPNVNFEGSQRPSSAIERLREQGGANDSTTSVDSKGQSKPSTTKTKRTAVKGPPPLPDFDTNAATILCSTTEEAMSVYSDAELTDHVMTLHMLNEKASKVLEYWLQRKDEGMREKEALEGVIENLVGFVKGQRGK